MNTSMDNLYLQNLLWVIVHVINVLSGKFWTIDFNSMLSNLLKFIVFMFYAFFLLPLRIVLTSIRVEVSSMVDQHQFYKPSFKTVVLCVLNFTIIAHYLENIIVILMPTKKIP